MCRLCSVSVRSGCCVRATGFYCYYDLRDRAMECEDWAELCDFRKLLRQMKFSNFSVASVRQAHFRALENLKVDAPFSQTSRFPHTKVFVNVSCSRYSDLLRQVSSSLSFKERDREVDRRAGVHAPDQDKPSSGSLPQQDASVAFYQAVESLTAELCRRTEVYDQIAFESKYQLKWCAGSVPPAPGPPGEEPGEPVDPPVHTWQQLRDAVAAISLNPDDYRYITQYPSYLVCGKSAVPLPKTGEVPTTPTARIVMFTQADYNRCSVSEKMPVVIFDEFSGEVHRDNMSGGDSLRERRREVERRQSDSSEFIKL